MAGSCSLGGRRRTSHKARGKKTRRHRRMRGGNGYGMGNNPIAVGVPEWSANMTSVEGGAPYMPHTLGGRRTSRRSRRSRRGMRGGGSVANVGASFQGDGARGLQTYVPYQANAPVGLVQGGSNGLYA
jgi:hypothetical protein